MEHIFFAPIFDKNWTLILLGFGAVITILSAFFLKKSAFFRCFSFLCFALLLLNPKWQEKEEKPLDSIVAIIIDKSESQKLNHRIQESEATLAQLKEKFKQYPNIKLRIATVTNQSLTEDSQTKLFTALSNVIADVAPEQIAGAIFITDGQVHDIPTHCQNLDFPAPINALITGNRHEFDRILQFDSVPSFAVIGQDVSLSFTVKDTAQAPVEQESVKVDLFINGQKMPQPYFAKLGEKTTISFKVPLYGKNIIELSTAPLKNELTPLNNRKVAVIHGIRQNLRVLLVSGEPYNGERIWRNLLKSDPNIDLVHFTILRPPEKADDTPTKDLALVAFPITDLFVRKIDSFDLVVFDRYQDYDVMPKLYYEFMARYVKNGGALLLIAGPEFVEKNSLAHSPLLTILPAYPDGKILNTPFIPKKTPDGEKHPITRDLKEQPKWGPWMRQIQVTNPNKSTNLLQGADQSPLLIVNQEGKGRVALLLSDESWLWARGFHGGGPYLTLYRNIAHWLMKDLNEEQLSANIEKNNLKIIRSTMKDQLDKVQVTFPSGKTQNYNLSPPKKGIASITIPAPELGIYKIKNGTLSAIAYKEGLEAPEFSDMLSTTKKLAPIVKCSKGHIIRIAEQKPVKTPPLSISAKNDNNQTIILRPISAHEIIGVKDHRLFSSWLALFLCLGSLILAWYRETR